MEPDAAPVALAPCPTDCDCDDAGSSEPEAAPLAPGPRPGDCDCFCDPGGCDPAEPDATARGPDPAEDGGCALEVASDRGSPEPDGAPAD